MILKARSLFDSATSRGRIQKLGDIACIVMDGGGSVCVAMAEFTQAQKWASAKPPTGNLLTDRARFLDQFTVLISRPNSTQVTRGNERALERVARAMRGAGFELSDWLLPPEMKDPKYWMPQEVQKRKAGVEAPEPVAESPAGQPTRSPTDTGPGDPPPPPAGR